MSVQVFDNVLPEEWLYKIQDTPMMFAGESSPIFDMGALPTSDEGPLSAVRHILHWLDEDDADLVEVWGRHELSSVPFHVDCNEDLLTEEHELVTPTFGHVLILKVHHPAPTLVYDDKAEKLYIIPPRDNRLIRFSGHLLHMVFPIPELEEMRRSTILFNTWQKDTCKFPQEKWIMPTAGDEHDFTDQNLEPVVVHPASDPASEDAEQSINFPAMYKDRYATNCPALPRAALFLKISGIKDLKQHILESGKRVTVATATRLD